MIVIRFWVRNLLLESWSHLIGFFPIIPSVCGTKGLHTSEKIVKYSKTSRYPRLWKKKHTHTGFATSPQIKRYKCIMLDMKSLYLILSQFDSTYQNSIKMLVVTLPFPYFFFNFILFRIFIKHEVSFFTFFPYKPKLEQTWKKKLFKGIKFLKSP